MKQTVEYLDVVNAMKANGSYDKPLESLDGIWKELVDEELKHSDFNKIHHQSLVLPPPPPHSSIKSDQTARRDPIRQGFIQKKDTLTPWF